MKVLNILNNLPIILMAALILAAGALPASAQDMRQNATRSLFSDKKAFQVGDAVTVLVVETSSASNDSRMSTSRRSDVSMGVSGNLPGEGGQDAGFTIGSGNQFRGEGAASSRGSVRAQIATRVDSVYANGDMLINGSRTIMVNEQKQLIKVSGVIRQEDIQADNTVFSSAISDAVIIFEDSGSVYRTRKPGFFTRIFHWLF
jgi:flagellar L-ring protein FlgH